MWEVFATPLFESFWPMCLTFVEGCHQIDVFRRLNKSRPTLRKTKLPHPRWVMLLPWALDVFRLDVFRALWSCRSMLFERWLGHLKRIPGKDCSTMTRSSQEFDMDFGHDCMVVYLVIRYWSCHLWCWNVLVMQTDGCEHVRAEGLSIWVSLFLMSLFAVSGGCIMHVVVCFWPDMAISKLLRFLIAGLRRTISSAEAGGATGFDCSKEMWGVFATWLFDPCAWLLDVCWRMSPNWCLQAVEQVEADASKDEAATPEVGDAFMLGFRYF